MKSSKIDVSSYWKTLIAVQISRYEELLSGELGLIFQQKLFGQICSSFKVLVQYHPLPIIELHLNVVCCSTCKHFITKLTNFIENQIENNSKKDG